MDANEEMQRERFCDVIDRASVDTSLVSVAARWGTNEQNLRRWRDNLDQSPKFDDLQAMLRRMTPIERLDVANVLFGAKLVDDFCKAGEPDIRRGVQALDEARSALDAARPALMALLKV